MQVYHEKHQGNTPKLSVRRRNRRTNAPQFTLVVDNTPVFNTEFIKQVVQDHLSGVTSFVQISGAITFVHWKDQYNRKLGVSECLKRLEEVPLEIISFGSFATPVGSEEFGQSGGQCYCRTSLPVPLKSDPNHRVKLDIILAPRRKEGEQAAILQVSVTEGAPTYIDFLKDEVGCECDCDCCEDE